MSTPASLLSTLLLGVLLLFSARASHATTQGFVDRATELGLDHEIATGFDEIGDISVFIPGLHLVDWAQRGAAVGDFDGDGDPDVVCCGGVLTNSVFRNDGGTFVDVSELAGIEAGEFDTAPAMADFDLDGDLDLYIGVVDKGSLGGVVIPGRGRFYRNLGGGVFEEISTLTGTPGAGYSIFTQWADLDSDGLLDLFLSEFYNTQNLVYRNNGDGTFTSVGTDIGIDGYGGTHATACMDADLDGNLDVFVANDWGAGMTSGLLGPNDIDKYYHGDGDGTYTDISAGSGADQLGGLMGLAIGDVNYDGFLDLYKTDLGENRMVINHGYPDGPPWVDEAAYYGIEAHPVPFPESSPDTNRGIGWGAVFLDADFDLWLDLFTVNGQVGKSAPDNQRNFLWTGDGPGAGFTFTDETAALGLFDEIDDRCCATTDYDDDGDLDLLITPTSGFIRFFENQIDPAGQGWLVVRPVCNTSPPGGFGVVARFTDSLGYPHVRQVGLDGPTAAQHENLAHFGLGDEASVDLDVTFPSGMTLSYPSTTPNQTIVPVEPELIRVSARTLPIGTAPSAGGSNRKPATVLPKDLYVVSAFAHDAAGNSLDENAVVTIDVPGLVALTNVIHIQGNEFRRYFEAPVVAGAHRAEVSFDGWTVKIRPRIHFYDANDASGTYVEVIPAAVRSGSSDTFDVIVAPKDTNGISLGPGDDVDIQIAGLVPLSGPTDLGDGRYRATFPAPAAAGVHEISVLHHGGELQLGASIEAAGLVDAATTGLHVEPPDFLASANVRQFRLLLTPRDASGLHLGPQADVQVTAIPSVGSVDVRSDLFPEGQRDGDFPFLIQKPDNHGTAGTLQISVEGVVVGSIPYAF